MKEKLAIAAVTTLLVAGCAAETETSGANNASEQPPPATTKEAASSGDGWDDASGEVREWPIGQWEPPPPSELEAEVGAKVARDNVPMGPDNVRIKVETSCQALKLLEVNNFQRDGDAASKALEEAYDQAEAEWMEGGGNSNLHFHENMDAMGYHCTAEEIEAILRENLQQDRLAVPG